MVVVWCGNFPIVIPIQVIWLCSAQHWIVAIMYWITLYCKGIRGGVVVVVVFGGGGSVVWSFSNSNTYPGYIALLCSALDCGKYVLDSSLL